MELTELVQVRVYQEKHLSRDKDYGNLLSYLNYELHYPNDSTTLYLFALPFSFTHVIETKNVTCIGLHSSLLEPSLYFANKNPLLLAHMQHISLPHPRRRRRDFNLLTKVMLILTTHTNIGTCKEKGKHHV